MNNVLNKRNLFLFIALNLYICILTFYFILFAYLFCPNNSVYLVLLPVTKDKEIVGLFILLYPDVKRLNIKAKIVQCLN